MSEIRVEALLVGPSVTEVCVAVLELVAPHALVTFEAGGVRLRAIDAPEASPTALYVGPGEGFVQMHLVPDAGPVRLDRLSGRLGCTMWIVGTDTSVDGESERVVHAGAELWSYHRHGSADEVEVRCDERGILLAGTTGEIAPERIEAARDELRAWTRERLGLAVELWPPRPPPRPSSLEEDELPF